MNGLMILDIDGLVVMKLIFGIKVPGTRTRTRRESKVSLSHTNLGVKPITYMHVISYLHCVLFNMCMELAYD